MARIEIDPLRLVYTRTAHGRTTQLLVRESGNLVVCALDDGYRTQTWRGDAWTDEHEDLDILVIWKILEAPELALLAFQYGRGPITDAVRIYEAGECHEIFVATEHDVAMPGLATGLFAKLRELDDLARARRFIHRRINPLRTTRSGEIG